MPGHDVRLPESAAIDPHAPEPAPPEAAEIPWHCPAFDPLLEARFLAEGERVWLRIARNWLILTAGLGALMTWAAPLSGPDTVFAALGLQGVLGLSAALLAARWLPRLPAGQLREAVFGLAAVIVLGCAALVGWWASEAFANRYVMAAAFSLMTMLLVVPLRLRASLAAALAGYAVLVASTLLSDNPYLQDCWDLLVFTALALPLGLRARMGAERDQRQLFLLRRREEAQRRALARANHRLHALAETDPLTGVANRRGFDTALSQALDPAMPGRPALVLLDIDHFKRLNDSCGHPQGDECLRLIARAVRSQVREGLDLVARIGGEEFAVLLPGLSGPEAAAVAERIRCAVEVLLLPHPGRPEPPGVVTVSLGVAVARTGEGVGSLMAWADRALYAAKAAGRNCVQCESLQPA